MDEVLECDVAIYDDIDVDDIYCDLQNTAQKKLPPAELARS
jgi:hypothetical protein